MDDRKQREVDANYAAFQKELSELLKSHRGKFALMRQGKVVQLFDSARDAMLFGQQTFADDLFSVQQVTDVPIDLGIFSALVARDDEPPDWKNDPLEHTPPVRRNSDS